MQDDMHMKGSRKYPHSFWHDVRWLILTENFDFGLAVTPASVGALVSSTSASGEGVLVISIGTADANRSRIWLCSSALVSPN